MAVVFRELDHDIRLVGEHESKIRVFAVFVDQTKGTKASFFVGDVVLVADVVEEPEGEILFLRHILFVAVFPRIEQHEKDFAFGRHSRCGADADIDPAWLRTLFLEVIGFVEPLVHLDGENPIVLKGITDEAEDIRVESVAHPIG